MLTPGLTGVLARVREANERWEQLACGTAAGMNPTEALVLSQVVLSFGIPFALVPLVLLTCRRDVTGAQVNRRVTTIFAWSRAVMIIGMNIFLICQQPFLSSDTPLPSTASQTPFRSSAAPGHTPATPSTGATTASATST